MLEEEKKDICIWDSKEKKKKKKKRNNSPITVMSNIIMQERKKNTWYTCHFYVIVFAVGGLICRLMFVVFILFSFIICWLMPGFPLCHLLRLFVNVIWRTVFHMWKWHCVREFYAMLSAFDACYLALNDIICIKCAISN